MFQNLYICSFSAPGGGGGVEIELTFALRAAISKIWVYFQNCHIWAYVWPLIRVLEVPHILIYSLSISRGQNWAIFTLWATVSNIWIVLQNWHIWAWNLAIGKSSKSCIYTPFLPHGVKFELIFALMAAFSATLAVFQNCHSWPWNSAIGKSSRSCTYTLFLLQRVKLSLFSLYRQRFQRYEQIFKSGIFGHEIWPLAKVPEVAHTLSFYPL